MRKTDVMQWRRETCRDYLRKIKPTIEAATTVRVDPAYGDALFAAWRAAGYPPLVWGSAALSTVLGDLGETLGIALATERERIRQLGRDAWIAETADRLGTTVATLEARFARDAVRWRQAAPDLPDDHAIVARLAIALEDRGEPAWIVAGIDAFDPAHPEKGLLR